jgi:hypothetical protein
MPRNFFIDSDYDIIAVDVLNILEMNMSYESISDAATWGDFNVGFLFQF